MTDDAREIHCCGCETKVVARLTDGSEVYPHRQDLYHLPFWRCDTCKNFVGCHHKTKSPTSPLGCIPTPEIKRARREIHLLLDPLWKNHPKPRKERKRLYGMISEFMGFNYHTAQLRTIDEGRKVYLFIKRELVK